MSERRDFNGLTEAEAERLAILIEECGEVIQAATKVLRHGYEDYSPFDDTKTPNRRKLEREIGHLLNAVRMSTTAGDTSGAVVDGAHLEKSATIGRWLHHQDPQS